MERLTERDEFGNADIIGVDSADLQLNLAFDEFNKATDALNKLAEYEELEEQGKLLKLPCAVGDTVWDKDFGQPCSYTVTGFSFGKIDGDDENDIKGLQMHYRNWNGSIRFSCAVLEIGKTVFLTKEDAEIALKGLQTQRKERAGINEQDNGKHHENK